MALAAEIGISPAALSKWAQGLPMSLEHACALSNVLDVSLDWLLLGREMPVVSNDHERSSLESEFLVLIRSRPAHILPHVVALLSAIPKPRPIGVETVDDTSG